MYNHLGIYSCLGLSRSRYLHKMKVQFRIPQYMGGDEANVVYAKFYNDTGSNFQTIYHHQFDQLDGPTPGCDIFRTILTPISTYKGVDVVPHAILELRIIKREADGLIKALTVDVGTFSFARPGQRLDDVSVGCGHASDTLPRYGAREQ